MVARGAVAARVYGGAAVLAVIVLLGIPLATMALAALRGPPDYLPFEAGSGFALDNIVSVARSGVFGSTFFDTIWFATCSTSVSFVVAFALAFLVERTDLPFRNVLFFAVVAPVTMPPLVHGLCWTFLLSRSTGLFNLALRPIFGHGPLDAYTRYGMVAAQSSVLVPMMFLFLTAPLRNVDPTLEEASWVSGCGPWRTIMRVTLPALRPAVFGVLIIGAVLSLESFEIPLLLGLGAHTRVLASAMYYPLHPQSGLPRYGEVAIFGLTFVVLTYALVAIQRTMAPPERYTTLLGKARRRRRLALGRARPVLLAFVTLYVLTFVVAPVGALVWSTLLDGYDAPTVENARRVSFVALAGLIDDPRFTSAFGNTVFVASATATLVAAIAFGVVRVVGRRPTRARALLDLVASSSIAVPAVVAGVGFLFFFLGVPGVRGLGLRGTLVGLVVASSYRVSVAYRMTGAAIHQLHPDLEDAGLVSGATPMNVAARITAPLIARTILSVWLVTFVVTLRDVTLPLLLGGPNTTMLGPFLWQLISNGEMGQASALAVLMTVVLVIAALLARPFTS